jgi:hypothetical protein
MGNKSSKPSTATYSQVPTVEIELENSQVPTVETEKDQKEISLKRMQSDLKNINAQIAQIASIQNSPDLSEKQKEAMFSKEQKEAMTTQKAVVEKAIGLLQDQSVTFNEYKTRMGIEGGSKKKSKSGTKKSSAKKSRAKKSRAKNSKSRAKKHRS